MQLYLLLSCRYSMLQLSFAYFEVFCLFPAWIRWIRVGYRLDVCLSHSCSPWFLCCSIKGPNRVWAWNEPRRRPQQQRSGFWVLWELSVDSDMFWHVLNTLLLSAVNLGRHWNPLQQQQVREDTSRSVSVKAWASNVSELLPELGPSQPTHRLLLFLFSSHFFFSSPAAAGSRCSLIFGEVSSSSCSRSGRQGNPTWTLLTVSCLHPAQAEKMRWIQSSSWLMTLTLLQDLPTCGPTIHHSSAAEGQTLTCFMQLHPLVRQLSCLQLKLNLWSGEWRISPGSPVLTLKLVSSEMFQASLWLLSASAATLHSLLTSLSPVWWTEFVLLH